MRPRTIHILIQKSEDSLKILHAVETEKEARRFIEQCGDKMGSIYYEKIKLFPSRHLNESQMEGLRKVLKGGEKGG